MMKYKISIIVEIKADSIEDAQEKMEAKLNHTVVKAMVITEVETGKIHHADLGF